MTPIATAVVPCCPCRCVLRLWSVFLSASHAAAWRELRGTRDTTPASCIAFYFLPALHGRFWVGIGARTWGHVITTEGRLPGAWRGASFTSTRDGSPDEDHSACEHASASGRGHTHHDRLRRNITELRGTSGTDERGGLPRQPCCQVMPRTSHRIRPQLCNARIDRGIDHASHRDGDRATTTRTRISRLCSHRLSGDVAGLGALASKGRCVTCTIRADSASVNAMLAREDENAGGTGGVTRSSLRHDAVVVHDRLRRASVPHDRLRRDPVTWLDPGSSRAKQPQDRAAARGCAPRHYPLHATT